MRRVTFLILLACNLATAGAVVAEPRYAWLEAGARIDPLEMRLPVPHGFKRVQVAPGSFGEWLRGLPLKPAGTPVRLHDGRLKGRQDVHAAVIDIDVGKRDLQQCADAIMRLRAEYLFSIGKLGEISFNATSGDAMPFSRWIRGERASFSGNKLKWVSGGKQEANHAALRTYLDIVFAYAGTHSLEKELTPVADKDLQIGDVFIKGGFPGHAVIVVDLAVDEAGSKRFLLAQSFMPAQDIHVLLAGQEGNGTAWYGLPGPLGLTTPEWTFPARSLRRFASRR